jgi:WW domain-binding protein 2
MDYGHHEQHASILSQRAREQDDADPQASWVMLTQSGQVQPLPNERNLHNTRGRVSFELAAIHQTPGSAAFTKKCENGTAYITNQRVNTSCTDVEP